VSSSRPPGRSPGRSDR